MSKQLQVQHQHDKQQFSIDLATEQALLQYQLDEAQQQINFYRTYVPASARGQGLAKLLVEAGLNWAKTQQYQISSSCSYVQGYLKHDVSNQS
jgi:predicted GNAT family acetyltransferase